MLKKIQNRLKNPRLNNRFVLKLIPLVVFLTILLLGTIFGIADPTTEPPKP
jgi:hypothetical protein